MFDSIRTHAWIAIALGLPLGLLVARASHAQLMVEDISIVAGVENSGWVFIVEVFGANITAATVAPPGGGPTPLTDASGMGEVFELEDGPFSTFAALKAVHPSGDYIVTVNGNHVVTLAWDPTEALASGAGQPTLVIDSPANGATDVSTMPDVAFTADCANCDDLRLEIEDVATGGMASGLNFGELDVAPAGNFTNPILFGDMSSGEGPPMALPNGLVDIELLVGLANFSDLLFSTNPSSHGTFQYIEASAVLTESTVTVPEPSAAAAAFAAIGALALFARRRPL